MEAEYKTPIYQRKAYQAYAERNRNNEEWKQKRREASKKSYYKKKELKKLSNLQLKLVDEPESTSSQSE